MEFRKIVAIIRTGKLEAVEDRLQAAGVMGITVTQVKGFGEWSDAYSPGWLGVHARIEIFTSSSEVGRIAQTILDAAHTGEAGDGILAVIPVETVYRIRTKAVAKAFEI